VLVVADVVPTFTVPVAVVMAVGTPATLTLVEGRESVLDVVVRCVPSEGGCSLAAARLVHAFSSNEAQQKFRTSRNFQC
jgi:hypothetical protein